MKNKPQKSQKKSRPFKTAIKAGPMTLITDPGGTTPMPASGDENGPGPRGP